MTNWTRRDLPKGGGGQAPAFNGLCMAIVQNTRESGELRLQAKSPGLHSAMVIISSHGAESLIPDVLSGEFV
jgi:Glycoside hydrolase family 2 C-terminal domain 5